MPRQNRLPFITPDENLSKIIGTKTIQWSDAIKNFSNYVKKNCKITAYKDFKA